VFGLLAEAEAQVHGQPAERVHFHEVGAIDALVDVVGVCAGLAHFGIHQLVCASPPAGHGTVQTAHGILPLPAPAVLELARLRGIPLASSAGFPAGELTTPTGLALMAVLAERFGPAPALVPQAVGIGLGSRQLDRPNQLRLVLAEEANIWLGLAVAIVAAIAGGMAFMCAHYARCPLRNILIDPGAIPRRVPSGSATKEEPWSATTPPSPRY
jgi:uncharacterized protein (DUF111 family)